MKVRSPRRKTTRLISLFLMLSLLLGAVPLTVSAEAKAEAQNVDLVSTTVADDSPISSDSQAEQRSAQFADGIYRMENAGPHLSATVDQTTLLTNTAPYLFTPSNSSLNQLWLITHVRDGLYTIRPYQNPKQKLEYNTSNGTIRFTTSTTNSTKSL